MPSFGHSTSHAPQPRTSTHRQTRAPASTPAGETGVAKEWVIPIALGAARLFNTYITPGLGVKARAGLWAAEAAGHAAFHAYKDSTFVVDVDKMGKKLTLTAPQVGSLMKEFRRWEPTPWDKAALEEIEAAFTAFHKGAPTINLKTGRRVMFHIANVFTNMLSSKEKNGNSILNILKAEEEKEVEDQRRLRRMMPDERIRERFRESHSTVERKNKLLRAAFGLRMGYMFSRIPYVLLWLGIIVQMIDFFAAHLTGGGGGGEEDEEVMFAETAHASIALFLKRLVTQSDEDKTATLRLGHITPAVAETTLVAMKQGQRFAGATMAEYVVARDDEASGVVPTGFLVRLIDAYCAETEGAGMGVLLGHAAGMGGLTRFVPPEVVSGEREKMTIRESAFGEEGALFNVSFRSGGKVNVVCNRAGILEDVGQALAVPSPPDGEGITIHLSGASQRLREFDANETVESLFSFRGGEGVSVMALTNGAARRAVAVAVARMVVHLSSHGIQLLPASWYLARVEQGRGEGWNVTFPPLFDGLTCAKGVSDEDALLEFVCDAIKYGGYGRHEMDGLISIVSEWRPHSLHILGTLLA